MNGSFHTDSSPHARRFPPIATIDHVSEDDIWDLLLADAISESESGRLVQLQRYLDGVPGLSRSGPNLHAAIAAILENGRRLGLERATLIEELKRDYPNFAVHVDEVELVQELMGDEADKEWSETPSRDLPCPYGPSTWHGEARYELQVLLGVGTRGFVYKALDRVMSATNKPAWVAIKIIPEWTGMLLREVLAEARRARHIDNPAVARVLDAGEHGDECFIVYEFIDGLTVADWRDARQLSQRERIETILPVIDAMGTAHATGLCHLDIHPRNVMVNSEGDAKLIDFGLGHTRLETWHPARRPVGSLGFVAPEIYNRLADPSLPKADVYALGGLSLWMLSGTIPNGQSIEESEFYLNAESGNTALERGLQGLDQDLHSILSRALSRQPERRYDSARGLARDLHSWLDRRPLDWNRPSHIRRLQLFARRSPMILLAWLVVCTLVIGATSALTAQRVGHEADLRVAEAEQREQLAQLEAQELAKEAKLGRQLRSFSGTIQAAAISDSTKRSAGRDWVVLLTLVRGLSEAGVQLEPEVLGTINIERVRIAEERAAEAMRLYGESDIQTRLWQAAKVNWLVDAEQYERALKELDEFLPQWRINAGDENSLVRRLDSLRRALTFLNEPRSLDELQVFLSSDAARLLNKRVLGRLQAMRESGK